MSSTPIKLSHRRETIYFLPYLARLKFSLWYARMMIGARYKTCGLVFNMRNRLLTIIVLYLLTTSLSTQPLFTITDFSGSDGVTVSKDEHLVSVCKVKNKTKNGKGIIR